MRGQLDAALVLLPLLLFVEMVFFCLDWSRKKTTWGVKIQVDSVVGKPQSFYPREGPLESPADRRAAYAELSKSRSLSAADTPVPDMGPSTLLG